MLLIIIIIGSNDCHPHPPYFSVFLLLKKKLKGRHLDAIEVTEAELQAVLNTLTAHDFQDAFKSFTLL
jgi:hypothetical protein